MGNKPFPFSKRELLDLLETIHFSLTIKNDQELLKLFHKIQIQLPCEHLFAGLGKTGSSAGGFQEPIKMVNVSWPAKWLDFYFKQNFLKVDPIIRIHFTRFKIQTWSETFRNVTSGSEKGFVEHARMFNLSEGITHGINCQRRSTGSLISFAGPHMTDHIRHKKMIEYIVPHLHLALMRTALTKQDKKFPLSSRELEVIKWVKEGKTNWEVSYILNISERTVKFHLQNIFTKLGASTRGHAVALALEQELIEL
ncbi:MAG: autoinducer binding domain-containing protein [Nitrospirae bacterium]|nr:autoinducer binding domain-containing protein [Nitrospirota bacterium]